MKIFARRDLILITCLVGITVVFLLSLFFTMHVGHLQSLNSLTSSIISYISQHKGEFPPSRTELLEFGVANEQYLDNFRIRYGIEYESIILLDGKLYDKNHNKLFLIKGTARDPLIKGPCETNSVKIYRAMTDYKDTEAVEKANE